MTLTVKRPRTWCRGRFSITIGPHFAGWTGHVAWSKKFPNRMLTFTYWRGHGKS